LENEEWSALRTAHILAVLLLLLVLPETAEGLCEFVLQASSWGNQHLRDLWPMHLRRIRSGQQALSIS
jgi:hypothetical protein